MFPNVVVSEQRNQASSRNQDIVALVDISNHNLVRHRRFLQYFGVKIFSFKVFFKKLSGISL